MKTTGMAWEDAEQSMMQSTEKIGI